MALDYNGPEHLREILEQEHQKIQQNYFRENPRVSVVKDIIYAGQYHIEKDEIQINGHPLVNPLALGQNRNNHLLIGRRYVETIDFYLSLLLSHELVHYNLGLCMYNNDLRTLKNLHNNEATKDELLNRWLSQEGISDITDTAMLFIRFGIDTGMPISDLHGPPYYFSEKVWKRRASRLDIRLFGEALAYGFTDDEDSFVFFASQEFTSKERARAIYKLVERKIKEKGRRRTFLEMKESIDKSWKNSVLVIAEKLNKENLVTDI